MVLAVAGISIVAVVVLTRPKPAKFEVTSLTLSPSEVLFESKILVLPTGGIERLRNIKRKTLI